MTTTTTPSTAAPARPDPGLGLVGPGRWIERWNVDDEPFWTSRGRAIARRNLGFSVFAEHIGFSVWLLWSHRRRVDVGHLRGRRHPGRRRRQRLGPHRRPGAHRHRGRLRRRRDAAHPVHLRRAALRRPQLDGRLGAAAARADARAGLGGAAPRDAVRRAAARRGAPPASAAATSPRRWRTSRSSTPSGRRAGRSASTPRAATSASPSSRSGAARRSACGGLAAGRRRRARCTCRSRSLAAVLACRYMDNLREAKADPGPTARATGARAHLADLVPLHRHLRLVHRLLRGVPDPAQGRSSSVPTSR